MMMTIPYGVIIMYYDCVCMYWVIENQTVESLDENWVSPRKWKLCSGHCMKHRALYTVTEGVDGFYMQSVDG